LIKQLQIAHVTGAVCKKFISNNHKMALICHYTLRSHVHFKYLARPGYCHLKKMKLQPSTDVDVVMLCCVLMLN